MNPFIAFVLALFVLSLVILAYKEGRRQGAKSAFVSEPDTQSQTSRKSENKQTIMDTLRAHGELSNADLREYLDVSPRTVVNYLDELEEEGKVVQVGNVGQSVVYRLK